MVDFNRLNKRNAFAREVRDAGFPFLGYCGHVERVAAPCGLPQFRSPSGSICAIGHGGSATDETTRLALTSEERKTIEMTRTRRRSPETDTATAPEGREVTAEEIFDPGFEPREGDKLFVQYGGVKLQIAAYSTVEIDGASYSRTLEVGDDPIEQFDKIHAFLDKKIKERARAKLATYADELAKAKKRAGGA